jgi:two-component system, OmpR family, sensor histidine kinase QseC
MTLQRRLLLFLTIAAPLVWAVTAGIAWREARHEIAELFDTQQVRFARQMLSLVGLADSGSPGAMQVPPVPMPPVGTEGAAELEDLSVAVWVAGRRLPLDDASRTLPDPEGRDGFVDLLLDGQPWRVFYLRTTDGVERVVAVGQSAAERDELAEAMMLSQLLPWMLMLPVLMAVLAFAVGAALEPVRALTRAVERRGAGDLSPIASRDVPAELLPLVGATNRLFERIGESIQQERRFTADAAHELRTPIAAVRAQWDAALLATDPHARRRAEQGVASGLDRLARLVSQMMAMARADAARTADASPQAGATLRPIDWHSTLDTALDDCLPLLESRDAQLVVDWPPDAIEPMPLEGDAALLATMLRNLVDNAIRYGREGGTVHLHFLADRIVVEDDGPGLDADKKARLGERFHRMGDSGTSGSGLGVSIARRVAALHGLAIGFQDRAATGSAAGLRVTIVREAPSARTGSDT